MRERFLTYMVIVMSKFVRLRPLCNLDFSDTASTVRGVPITVDLYHQIMYELPVICVIMSRVICHQTHYHQYVLQFRKHFLLQFSSGYLPPGRSTCPTTPHF